MSVKTDTEQTSLNVSLRQWFRLVAVYLLIPLSLFISAGELCWWQGMLYSAQVLVAGLGGRIWAEKRHPGLTAERQNISNIQNAKTFDKVLAPLMALSISYPMVIVAGLDHRYNWSAGFPFWLVVVGFILIFFGYAYATWALVENRFFSSVVRIQTERGHVVCDSGPYRFVRHPGYAGNMFALFGIVLAFESLWVLIPAVVASIITVIRTELEDKTLRQELPGYNDYTKRVRYRLIPWIY